MKPTPPQERGMPATQPETMLLAEAMRTRGLCVSIVQLPRGG